ncbi:Fe-S cluster assembly protein SufD [Ignatzschineria ureiclastica]|nr:SufD family Fe-S cluster assembly protein [Ignatzschineria ureiclastica]GGZ98731.1 Fe-S cluster assembly protein SufD [Ignatzschineria ureiclastica]
MLTKYQDNAHRERFRDTPLRKLFSTAWQAPVSKEASAPVNETLPEGAIILPIYNGEVASRWIHELSLPESLLVRATSNLLEIRLMNGAVVDRPIVIYHVTDGQDAAVQVDFNIVVTAEEGSQASFLLVEAGNGEYLNLGTMSVSLAESANIEFVHAGINSKVGSSLFDFVATQATESQLHYMSYQSQGAITRSDIAFSVEGEGAYSELNVLNIAEGREHISHVVDLDHKVPNCSSNQQVKNILKDRAEALFDAQIHVFQDAQKIDADQMTRSLLLNDGARALTIPRLLIYADDVRCTHGATVGFIEPDHLFYLRSRGISAEEAKKMLIRAYAVEIVDTIRSESIRDWLAHRLDHDIAILL